MVIILMSLTVVSKVVCTSVRVSECVSVSVCVCERERERERDRERQRQRERQRMESSNHGLKEARCK